MRAQGEDGKCDALRVNLDLSRVLLTDISAVPTLPSCQVSQYRKAERGQMMKCPLCDGEAEGVRSEYDFQGEIHGYACRRCGRYRMTFEAQINSGTMDPRARLWVSPATRQSSDLRHPLLLRGDDLDGIAAERERTMIPENLEKLLNYLRIKCPRPGMRTTVNRDNDFTIIDAVTPDELDYIIAYAEEEKYIGRTTSPDACWLTPKGWERLSKREPTFIPGRCFVAMAFRNSLSRAFTDGISKAVEDDCGFHAVRMLELEHNDKICDRIIVELRRAQFVIADFTFQRGGVYFEAGFAAALGRPVIWTCKACHFHRLHFDTRQYNHIRWEQPQDLRTSLTARIRGTIPGARLAD